MVTLMPAGWVTLISDAGRLRNSIIYGHLKITALVEITRTHAGWRSMISLGHPMSHNDTEGLVFEFLFVLSTSFYEYKARHFLCACYSSRLIAVVGKPDRIQRRKNTFH